MLAKKEEEPIFIADEAGEDGPDDGKVFVYNAKGLSSAEAAAALEKYGRNELPEKKVPKWKIFVNLLIAPMPLMIFFAAFIEWSIDNFADMCILLFISFANAVGRVAWVGVGIGMPGWTQRRVFRENQSVGC